MTNIHETISVKSTRKIFRESSLLISATGTDYPLMAELTPRNSVWNFRVNGRRPKAIAGWERPSTLKQTTRHNAWLGRLEVVGLLNSSLPGGYWLENKNSTIDKKSINTKSDINYSVYFIHELVLTK